LKFILGYDIIIDASLSYDQGILQTSGIDSNLNFTWICPDLISSACINQHTSILKLSPNETSNLISDIVNSKSYNFILIISKDIRTATTNFSVVITKPENTNSTNGSSIDLSQLIQIYTAVVTNEFILFNLTFLANINNLSYHWTISGINDANYINGRNQQQLKVQSSGLSVGINLITLDITSNNTITTIYYNYTKSSPPYGGNCIVNPNIGISMNTTFNFIANNWQSINQPLKYEFNSINSLGISIPLTSDFIYNNTYSSSFIPSGNNYSLVISDSSGLTTITYCDLTVKPNNDSQQLDALLNTKDPSQALLSLEVYTSSTTNLSSNFVNKSLSILTNILNSNNNVDVNTVISQATLITTSNVNLSSDVKKQMNNIISGCIQNLGNIQDKSTINAMTNLIGNYIGSTLIDNSSPSNSNTNSSNNNNQNSNVVNSTPPVYDVDEVKSAINLVDTMNEKLLSNMLIGETNTVKYGSIVSSLAKLNEQSGSDLSVEDSNGNKFIN
jgi:hypothetical protein